MQSTRYEFSGMMLGLSFTTPQLANVFVVFMHINYCFNYVYMYIYIILIAGFDDIISIALVSL